MLWVVKYRTAILAFLEAADVIILHIIEDHQFNNSLQITQFISKWQLASFYRTGAKQVD
jgi:hypothetical protein